MNFIDIYFRTGLYKADPPIVLGMEAAGTVEAVGPDVSDVKPGDRVAYAMSRGSYAEYAVVPAWQLVPVPDGLDLKTAAAVMLQGMTAHYLTHSTFPLKQGDTCLAHAAAGGVGLLLVQIAKKCGARVIGTAGSEEKARTGSARRARTRHHLYPAGFSARGKATDGRARRGRRLRFRRRLDFHEEPRLSAAARNDGDIRKCQRPGPGVRHRCC